MPQEHTGKVTDHAKDSNRIISQKLKALYSAVEQEGIPDRFMSLLEQLDEAERRGQETETVDGHRQ